MKKVMKYETELDELLFAYYDEETKEMVEVQPDTPFERAVVDSLDNLREAIRDELVELNERLEDLGA